MRYFVCTAIMFMNGGIDSVTFETAATSQKDAQANVWSRAVEAELLREAARSTPARSQVVVLNAWVAEKNGREFSDACWPNGQALLRRTCLPCPPYQGCTGVNPIGWVTSAVQCVRVNSSSPGIIRRPPRKSLNSSRSTQRLSKVGYAIHKVNAWISRLEESPGLPGAGIV